MISRLRDDRGVDKVVEKLERTDTTVDERFAMRTGRAPEPVLKKLKRPSGRWTGGSCRLVERLRWHEICLQSGRGHGCGLVELHSLARHLLRGALRGSSLQELAFPHVLSHRRGSLELGARLFEPANLPEKVASDGRQ